MVRLFVALDFPPSVRERLTGLAGGVPGARWVAPENLHVTLRFIGEVDDARLDDIDLALGRVDAPAFPLVLEGVGRFGRGARPHALWAGVAPSPALNHLQSKIESALVRAGLAPETRTFLPHVTLASLKLSPLERVARFLAERALFRAGPIAVEQFGLFESHLSHNGSIYHLLRAYRLAPAASGPNAAA
ncbi:MAG: RNA 2',3'-cyclic phosphodiesterase [Azospirillum sp.]|nr:RNA 2',3'-cyclic phosphodiesterase [Azospirillum sp.]